MLRNYCQAFSTQNSIGAIIKTQGPAFNLCSFEQGKGGVVYTDMSFMRRLHPKGMPQSISNYAKGSDIKRSQDLTEN